MMVPTGRSTLQGMLVSSVNTADAARSTHSSTYTAAMFSETRYALNGDLRVAYRASREGPRDIVSVPNWFTCCEVLPELPSIQGWVDAMTSLGRLIYFDQPGTGASDPVTPGALPTLEQWADSITAVLDALGSREAVLVASNSAFAPAALFAATHPSRTSALVVLDGYADASGTPLVQGKTLAARVRMWGTGEYIHAMNPDMPWNEEIRAAWARMERLAGSPRTVALMMPLATEVDVRAVLPTVRVPTLVVQHSDDVIVPPAKGKYIAGTTSSNRGASPSRRSRSSSPATRPT
jgi:pimeloyl-ACP methyl ester carboxylesterase